VKRPRKVCLGPQRVRKLEEGAVSAHAEIPGVSSISSVSSIPSSRISESVVSSTANVGSVSNAVRSEAVRSQLSDEI